MNDQQQPEDGRGSAESSGARGRPECKLKPVSENPWYILATIHGEQPSERIDSELHARNRRTWNRWMLAALDDGTKQLLVEKHGVDPDDLVPFEEHERTCIKRLAAGRFKGLTLADPGSAEALTTIDFREVDCTEQFVASGFVFPGVVQFVDVIVTGTAWFDRANFLSGATFRGVTFMDGGLFEGALFWSVAIFSDVTFEGMASFEGATFEAFASFHGATFWSIAGFRDATFLRSAAFQRTKFHASTGFDCARFKLSPDFRDGTFPFATTWRDIGWPDPNRQTAPDDVEHYAALRHAMRKAERPDHELQFFVLELDAKRHTEADLLQRLAISAFLALAKGGRSLGRPFGAWAAALFASFLAQAVALKPDGFAIPSPYAYEILRVALGSALVVGVPIFDPRRLEFIERALSTATADAVTSIPGSLQLFQLAHAGFSALCLFLMALARSFHFENRQAIEIAMV